MSLDSVIVVFAKNSYHHVNRTIIQLGRILDKWLLSVAIFNSNSISGTYVSKYGQLTPSIETWHSNQTNSEYQVAHVDPDHVNRGLRMDIRKLYLIHILLK